MSVLKSLQGAPQTAHAGNKGYSTFGLALEVTEASEVDGKLSVKGRAVNSNKYVAEGELIAVSFRGDSAGRSITNFEKGCGKSWRKDPASVAGSVVTIESAYVDGEVGADGHKPVSGRWLNTVRNIRNADHEDRTLLSNVLAQPPRVTFDNPSVRDGEPARISVGMVGDTFIGRVKTDHGTFKRELPRALAVEKLAEVVRQNGKVRVQQDILEPNYSVRVHGKDELVAALTKQLARGTDAFAMIRVADATAGDEVLTRMVHVLAKKEGDQYLPDVEGALKELFSNNLIAGVKDTDALLAAVESGELVMESVPGYRLAYAGSTANDNNISFKLMQDVLGGHTTRYEMIFGKHSENFAQVLLPGISRGADESLANFQPTNLLGDEHGTFTGNTFPTAYIANRAAPAAALIPEEDRDPASVQTPVDLAESFDSGLAEADEDVPVPAFR